MYELAINLPIHNEEKSITHVINEWVDELKKLEIDYCLIVSEDGSTDNTKSILLKFIALNSSHSVSNITKSAFEQVLLILFLNLQFIRL